jgi:hypothetical protein
MKTILLLTTLLAAVHLSAADADKTKADAAKPAPKPKPKAETYLTVETAGRDYADQGEYLNDWGGAQVIALGADKFRLVSYKGGLPGAGWDKETKSQAEGKRDGDKIVFTGTNGYKAELADGTITIHTADGGPWTMKKTTRTSPTLGAKPPAGAAVLFDIGQGTEEFAGGHLDARGLLAAGSTTKKKFQNFSMHCEFLLPFKPLGRGQDRGNSGVYLQDRYEIQVLDSFGLKGEDNECGGIYTTAKPAVNMCFPPLVWQTYDIDFTAAQFDADAKKTRKAVVTVRHNGVIIHDKQEIPGSTGGGRPESPAPGPIQLQGHGNPVFYRNVWILEK